MTATLLTQVQYPSGLLANYEGNLQQLGNEDRFLGWGQAWCENVRPERARMLAQTNPHSPGRHRVNGVLSNMAEFQKAFSCKAGAPMVRQAPCHVW